MTISILISAPVSANQLKNDTWGLQLALNNINSPYLIYLTIDESDQTGFLDAGPDFTTVDDANTGVLSAGYNAANVAWIALVTAPTQTSNNSQGVTYSNTTVYTKQELSNWLSARYGGEHRCSKYGVGRELYYLRHGGRMGHRDRSDGRERRLPGKNRIAKLLGRRPLQADR